MTTNRALLLACRHRIANDCMARGEEPDPLVDDLAPASRRGAFSGD